MAAQSWTLDWWGRPFEATFEGCDFNLIFAMRLWSPPFFPGAGMHGGFLSPVPIAAWLNPLLTTGYAVEISKYFNIQPRGMQSWLECAVASGLSMEEAQLGAGMPMQAISTHRFALPSAAPV
jgi:hypothetical protein